MNFNGARETEYRERHRRIDDGIARVEKKQEGDWDVEVEQVSSVVSEEMIK